MNVDKLKEVFGEWPLRVGEFHKVSYDQFRKDWLDTFCEPTDADLRENTIIEEVYNTLPLPTRSTIGSGGFDFYSPISFVLDPGDDIMIPTGINVEMLEGWCLVCMPRSGMGNKYYIRIAGTLGLIDSDYYYSLINSGHCFIKIRNEGDKRLTVSKGDKFCQGVFVIHGVTFNDDVVGVRNGGFGSTN